MREASVQQAEARAGRRGTSEWKEHIASHPLFTFRIFLEGQRRPALPQEDNP